ncbi:MAG: hypothetical protein Q9166_006848 [cf. Caloplaca sp. 2 TL-2023]
MVNYYDVLGITKNATREEIEKTYTEIRSRAIRANDLLLEAGCTLRNLETREAYDKMLLNHEVLSREEPPAFMQVGHRLQDHDTRTLPLAGAELMAIQSQRTTQCQLEGSNKGKGTAKESPETFSGARKTSQTNEKAKRRTEHFRRRDLELPDYCDPGCEQQRIACSSELVEFSRNDSSSNGSLLKSAFSQGSAQVPMTASASSTRLTSGREKDKGYGQQKRVKFGNVKSISQWPTSHEDNEDQASISTNPSSTKSTSERDKEDGCIPHKRIKYNDIGSQSKRVTAAATQPERVGHNQLENSVKDDDKAKQSTETSSSAKETSQIKDSPKRRAKRISELELPYYCDPGTTFPTREQTLEHFYSQNIDFSPDGEFMAPRTGQPPTTKPRSELQKREGREDKDSQDGAQVSETNRPLTTHSVSKSKGQEGREQKRVQSSEENSKTKRPEKQGKADDRGRPGHTS